MSYLPTVAHVAAWFVFVRNFEYEIHDHKCCQLGPLNTFRLSPGWILCRLWGVITYRYIPLQETAVTIVPKLLLWLEIFYCSYGAHIIVFTDMQKIILLCKRSFLCLHCCVSIVSMISKADLLMGNPVFHGNLWSAQVHINPNLVNPFNRTCSLHCFLHSLLSLRYNPRWQHEMPGIMLCEAIEVDTEMAGMKC